MTHDFARQRVDRANRAAKPTASPWLWFLTGAICGSLLSVLVYLATLTPQPRTGASPAFAGADKPPAETAPAQAAPPGKPLEEPKFTFYELLPEGRMTLGERAADRPPAAAPRAAPATQGPGSPQGSTTNAQATARTPAGTTASPPPTTPPAPAKPVEVPEPPALLLQAGSFRQQAEADRRRANILLLGYPARVETVNARAGETWYRVRVGPFSDAKAMSEARGALRDQGIESVEIGKRA